MGGVQGGKLAPQKMDVFNRQRLKTYGHLAMMAPQSVVDAQDNMMDHLMQVANAEMPYDWVEVRKLALGLINEIRKDLKFDTSPINYNGDR